MTVQQGFSIANSLRIRLAGAQALAGRDPALAGSRKFQCSIASRKGPFSPWSNPPIIQEGLLARPELLKLRETRVASFAHASQPKHPEPLLFLSLSPHSRSYPLNTLTYGPHIHTHDMITTPLCITTMHERGKCSHRYYKEN